jgi:hypothetical protein
MSRPCRSVLYIPGSRERALEKACTLPADAIIFDLEDAVTPEEKPAARDLLARVVRDFDFGAGCGSCGSTASTPNGAAPMPRRWTARLPAGRGWMPC